MTTSSGIQKLKFSSFLVSIASLDPGRHSFSAGRLGGWMFVVPCLVSSRLVSSRLVSSRLASPRLASPRLASRLVSSRLVSSRLVSSRLVSSRLVSSRSMQRWWQRRHISYIPRFWVSSFRLIPLSPHCPWPHVTKVNWHGLFVTRRGLLQQLNYWPSPTSYLPPLGC